ncbi:MAG: HD domain-containing protein [Halorubrum sp.]
MATTQIKDPVHGYVELPDALVDGVVDTRPFQRLRYVRQLSATHLVYPGANHTRFEHSVGVYHLGRTVFENLREQSYFTQNASTNELAEIQRTLECACLLHDVGHPPFSHLSEGFLDESVLRERVADVGLVDAFDDAGVGGAPLRSANPHELLGCVLIVETYGDALRAFDVDPFEVCAYVLGYSLAYERGEPWQYGVGAQLLHSPIDVDRLDYITRDNRMTGAGVLSFDVERMVEAYTAHPEEGLALSEKALSTIGNYLEGRIALYMWVTQHHKSVYANRLLQALLGEYAKTTGESPVTVDGVLTEELDDNAVLERLRVAARDAPNSTLASMYERFRGRQFPATCWKHRIALADRIDADIDAFAAWLTAEEDRLEALLADALDVPPHEVWIDRSYVPAYDPDELEDIPIAYGGTTRSVGDWGLYGDRAFDVPIPFVFVPHGAKRQAIRLLQAAFEHENRPDGDRIRRWAGVRTPGDGSEGGAGDGDNADGIDDRAGGDTRSGGSGDGNDR